MSGFRVIAIKTGKKDTNINEEGIIGTESQMVNWQGNLGENIFCFYNSFRFPNRDFSKIEYNPELDHNIFPNLGAQTSINICAIVGENGSGKSSLVELFYWVSYNISTISKKLLYKSENTSKYNIDPIKDGEYYIPNTDLAVEILYQTKHDLIYSLHIKGNKIEQKEFHFKDSLWQEAKDNLSNITIKYGDTSALLKIQDYFYTIALNYSLHGLNDLEIGHWITPLFHKNDSYQCPIVLNPKRSNGNINVNNQNKLAQRRLQSILLEPPKNKPVNESLRNLANGKIAHDFKLEHTFGNQIFDEDSFNLRDGQDYYATFQEFESTHQITREIVGQIKCSNVRELANFGDDAEALAKKSNKNQLSFYDELMIFSVKYLITKLKTIRSRYIELELDIDDKVALKQLLLSKSHISFKVKSIFFYLRFALDIFGDIQDIPEDPITINIEEQSQFIENKIISKVFLDKQELPLGTFSCPFPNFFKVDISFKDEKITFSNLSSGEKQKILGLSTIAYHLVNINSVDGQTICPTNNNLPKLINKTFKDLKKWRAEENDILAKIKHSQPSEERFDYENELEQHRRQYKTPNVKYQYVNIILDEIELYYHPEWQRTYIHDLLNYLDKINSDSLHSILGINIIFVTHSPFILSDIPHTNVMRLEDGSPKDFDPVKRTFGANIHKMLIDDFFMKKGFLGSFANEKINEMIRLIIDSDVSEIENQQSQIQKSIDLIGEDAIRNKLNDMFNHRLTYHHLSIEDFIKSPK